MGLKTGAASNNRPWLEFAVRHRAGPGFALDATALLHAPLTLLVGPSGAGKTTLLRAIAGLLRPEDGRILIHGGVVWDSATGRFLPPAKRGCGLAMQRPALFPSMTAEENIAFGLQRLPRAQRIEQVRSMARIFRLEPVLARHPTQLSGGEQQRVALARTLAPAPRIVLLDEPFAGLHLQLKNEILADLESWLAETRTPALYVTHDVAEAWRLGSRPDTEVLRMEQGRIVAQGPASQVIGAERAQLLAALE